MNNVIEEIQQGKACIAHKQNIGLLELALKTCFPTSIKPSGDHHYYFAHPEHKGTWTSHNVVASDMKVYQPTEVLMKMLDLLNQANTPSSTGKFMVSVDGARAPKIIHPNIEVAREEAKRLALEEETTARVLELKYTYSAKLILEEHKA